MLFNLTAGRCAVLWTTWIYKNFPMYILEAMYSGMPNKRIVRLLIFGKTPCLYVLFGSIRLLNFRIFSQPIDHLVLYSSQFMIGTITSVDSILLRAYATRSWCRQHASHMPATCQPHSAYMLTLCWQHAGNILITCHPYASHMLATCW